MTQWITSPQKKQIERLMADALGNTNPDKDGAQRLIERGDQFMAYVMAGISRFTTKAPNYEIVRQILGLDFISHEEISAARDLNYSVEQIADLERTLPDRKTLEWLKRNDYYLVAGSPREMSLLDIRELECSYLYSKKGGWYEWKEVFARNDKVTCRWLVLRKTPVPNSTRKTWSEQEKLLSDFEVVPNVAEMVWGLTTYKAVRNVCLLHSVYVRTSSVDSHGNLVVVGDFGGDGLSIAVWHDGRSVDYVGLSSSRKSDPCPLSPCSS